MKYSIHGFSQQKAMELGLSNDDLLVLRWFVDFAGTDRMKTMLDNEGVYYWVNYSTVLEDLPVLNVSKRTLKRKHFDKLCESKVLKHKHIKSGGSFSYYAYGINYDLLVYLQETTPRTESSHPRTESSYPLGQNRPTPRTESSHPCAETVPTKINLLNNSSIKDQSINKNIYTPPDKPDDDFSNCMNPPVYDPTYEQEEQKEDKPKKNKPVKHKYGEYNNVLLSDEELDKLKTKFPDWEERIENLSIYIESKGARYKSHYATILSWARREDANKSKMDSRWQNEAHRGNLKTGTAEELDNFYNMVSEWALEKEAERQ